MQYGHLGGERSRWSENLNHLRCVRASSVGNITTLKCWDQDVGGQTFVLDESRLMWWPDHDLQLDTVVKKPKLHSLLPRAACGACIGSITLRAAFLSFPTCMHSITGTWAGPGAGHLHLKLTIPWVQFRCFPTRGKLTCNWHHVGLLLQLQQLVVARL